MRSRFFWASWEPRFGFPVFTGIRAFVSFSIHPEYRPINYQKLFADTKNAFSTSPWFAAAFVKNILPVVLFCRNPQIHFRLILMTRQGKYLATHSLPGSYPPGGSIDVDVSGVLQGLGYPDGDYMAILVMSNGRHDGFRSSPGAYSMTYVGENTFSTYRTGGFTRILNDPRKKSHYGFRGINPTVVASSQTLSSLLLINHSSYPRYSATVVPTTILLRGDGETREASFGPIPPFGGVERTIEDLFGSDVVDFLRPFGGRGTTITTCPGVTLASLHLVRSRDGSSFSIEHSRPTHTYLRGVMRLDQKIGREAVAPDQRVRPLAHM